MQNMKTKNVNGWIFKMAGNGFGLYAVAKLRWLVGSFAIFVQALVISSSFLIIK
jgi:hypothetical protein